jgi:hypothetical protein
LSRLAGLNPVQDNALRLAPLPQPDADELGALVREQLRGQAVIVDQAHQHLHHPGGAQPTC